MKMKRIHEKDEQRKNDWNESKKKEQITFKWRNENENEYMKKNEQRKERIEMNQKKKNK